MRKEQVREPGARAEVRGSRDSKEAGVTGAPHRTSRTPGAGRQSGAGLGGTEADRQESILQTHRAGLVSC